MGAYKSELRNTPMPLSPLLIGAGAFLLVALLFQTVIFNRESPALKLSRKEELKLEKRLREIDDSEQYALVAIASGWYPCLHSGRTTYYLKTGEVWKYGVTSKGEFGRYAVTFLVENKVSYIIQFKGNFAECLKQEQIRLFNYAYLPENLLRPKEEQLRRPPFNSIMR